MAERIVLDTSFVVGLIDEKDVWCARAQKLQAVLEAADFKPVIFDCVLSEVISTLARRTHEKRRAALFSELLGRIRSQFPAKSIVWVSPDLPMLYDRIVGEVEKSGGELNFNDALIVLACRHRRLEFLASFDADFDRVEGLQRIGSPEDLERLHQTHDE